MHESLRFLSSVSEMVAQVNPEALKSACQLIKAVKDRGSRVYCFGNGGSAAICSHLAIDLANACAIRASSWPDSSTLTCLANDYGYDLAISKYLDRHFDTGDLLILVSSSGQSKNILNAASMVRDYSDSKIISFSGFEQNNPLRQLADVEFWVGSANYNVVELIHQAWTLALIEQLRMEIST